MTSFQVHSAEFFAGSAKNFVIVFDNKDLVEQFNADSAIAKALKLSDERDIALIKLAASKLSPSTDFAASSELQLFSPEDATIIRKAAVAVLPTACSRHNTPARSHAVSAVVKSHKGSEDLVVLLVPAAKDRAYAQICAAGRAFPSYSLKSGKAAADKDKSTTVEIVVHLPGSLPADDVILSDGLHTITNIRLAQHLVDSPPNILHSDSYIEECRRVASELGCQIHVISGHDLEAQGFGGLWGVGKASEHLPALVVLSHTPAGAEGKQSVCLVGKGIVYDTGGLSIKTPTTSMAGMKTDMGGSAAVLGAFATAVTNGRLAVPLHGLLCIAENSVGPLATRPDDIHTLLSGKTVEVNNTDAEGRLVLSDGVFYAAKHLNPAVIADIATLTGAQLIATGKNHAAIYCNDEALEGLTVKAGKDSGDLTFPIPYCPEFYRNEFRSVVADYKNSVADRGNAQASCAGQFIGNSLEDYFSKGGKWVHVDMAGPVSVGERATGYGVALLSVLAQYVSDNSSC